MSYKFAHINEYCIYGTTFYINPSKKKEKKSYQHLLEPLYIIVLTLSKKVELQKQAREGRQLATYRFRLHYSIYISACTSKKI